MVGAAASVLVMAYVTFYSRLHFYLYAVIGIMVCVFVGYAASVLLPTGQNRDLTGLTRARVK